DQYSLAVTYVQLRTGRLPFRGPVADVLLGHLHREPDLSGLPEAERAAVARALAKVPEDRWPSCRTFAKGLELAARDREDRIDREALGEPAASPQSDRTWTARTPETRRGGTTTVTAPAGTDRRGSSASDGRREQAAPRVRRGRTL